MTGEEVGRRTSPDIRRIERSGDAVHLLCSEGERSFEVMARVSFDGSTLVVSGLIADGAGANTVGVRFLRDCARVFARGYGATRIEIHGGERTTGGAPGHLPRSI